MRRVVARLGVSALVALGFAFAACVGEDPVANPGPSSDASLEASPGSDGGGSTDGGSSADAGGDAAAPACDLDKPFEAAAAVPGVNAGAEDDRLPYLSPDELTMYFTSGRPTDPDAGAAGLSIWRATRSAKDVPFTTPVAIPEVNALTNVSGPAISADGTALVFEFLDVDHTDLYASTKMGTAWSTPVKLDNGINTPDGEGFPFLLGDELWFTRGYDGKLPDMWRAPKSGAGWGPPVRVDELSAPGAVAPVLTPDGRRIYFATWSTDNYDVWTATRAGSTGPFGTATAVAELNSDGNEIPRWVSPDGCRLYMSRLRRNGGSDFDVIVASKPKR